MRLVVDTNILIAALIRDSMTRHILIHLNAEFITLSYSEVEIQKHKAYILAKVNMQEEEFDRLRISLTKRLTLLDEQNLILYWQDAIQIMDKIDPDDTAFIAAALATKSDIWSDDKHFERQNKVKVWKTKDLVALV